MSAIALAKNQGIMVLATTRSLGKVARLREQGADHVLIDTGTIADDVKRLVRGGVNAVLELVGASALPDPLQASAPTRASFPLSLAKRARKCMILSL